MRIGCLAARLVFYSFCCAAVLADFSAAQTALTTIDNPKGGKIVYGPVDGQRTTAGAMGAILRNLHQQYGDRPQVGKVFQVKGTKSVAVFFTLVKKTQDNKQVAGMVIASNLDPNHVEAALISDDASRFGTTVNPMLKTLFARWHPGGESRAAGSSASASDTSSSGAAAATLKHYSLPDNSAAAAFPDGWQVSPASGGGTIIATGPNGELANLGVPLGAYNSNDPSVQRTMQFAQRSGQNTSYARASYYPYGQDLGKTMVDLIAMFRQKRGMEAPVTEIANESPFPSNQARCAHITGHTDLKDGKGNRELDAIYCVGPLSRIGHFAGTLFATSVPVAFADKERAAMGAVLASFTENTAVIQAEANAIAAPEIARIHEIGRRAAQQAADAHAANDAHNRAVEQHWDDNDKHGQAFGNYLLDQTVILDSQNNAHGTVWNQTADAMVKNDPNRYSYVNTPDFWKGIDY
jgi:hypothetical protein